MRGMLARAFRAARFDRATYRDVLGDEQAILNALGIVILGGFCLRGRTVERGWGVG